MDIFAVEERIESRARNRVLVSRIDLYEFHLLRRKIEDFPHGRIFQKQRGRFLHQAQHRLRDRGDEPKLPPGKYERIKADRQRTPRIENIFRRRLNLELPDRFFQQGAVRAHVIVQIPVQRRDFRIHAEFIADFLRQYPPRLIISLGNSGKYNKIAGAAQGVGSRSWFPESIAGFTFLRPSTYAILSA
jgi:hypothetical protein